VWTAQSDPPPRFWLLVGDLYLELSSRDDEELVTGLAALAHDLSLGDLSHTEECDREIEVRLREALKERVLAEELAVSVVDHLAMTRSFSIARSKSR
jgi:hypothetical protein